MIVESFYTTRRIVAGSIQKCLESLISTVQAHFGGRLSSLKVAAGTLLLSLVTCFPHYGQFNRSLSADPIIQAICFKVKNPLAPIPSYIKVDPRDAGITSHIDKLELRLTVPVLGRLSGTGKWTIVVWSPLAGFGVFALLAKLGSKALNDEVGGALFVLALGPTFFGFWFLNDLDFGDGIAFFFLLLSIATSSALISYGSFVAAAFCDERCVAAAPLLFLYLMFSQSFDPEKRVRAKPYIAILLAGASWGLLRIWFEHAFHLTMGTTMLATWAVFRDNMYEAFPYVFLDTFRASWTLPLFAMSVLVLQRKRLHSWMFAGAFALAIAPALLVVDFYRSACYTFVILLVSLHFLWGDAVASRRCLAGILVLNMLLISPGQSIFRIPFQMLTGFHH